MGKTVREEKHLFFKDFHDAFWKVDPIEIVLEVEDFHLPETVFIEKLNATYRLKRIENRAAYIKVYDGIR